MTEQPSASRDKTPNREELLELLDAEIGHIHAQESRGGWNLWGALVAFTASSWMLLEVAQTKDLVWANAARVAIAGTMLVDLVVILVGMLSWTRTRSTRKRRYLFTQGFGHARIRALYSFLRILALLTLATWFSQGIVALLFIYVAYGFLLIAVSLSLLRTWKSLVVLGEQSVGLRASTIGAVITLALLAWPIFTYTRAGAFPGGAFDPLACKAGGLIVVAIMTLSLATVLGTKEPLLDTLVRIRRDLVLQNLEVSRAAKQLDVALFGMKGTDLVQQRCADLLELLNEIQAHQREASEWLEIVQDELTQIQAKANSVSDKEFEELVDEVDSDQDDLDDELQEIEKTRGRFQKSLDQVTAEGNALSTNSKVVERQFPGILGRIKLLLHEADERTKVLQTESQRTGEQVKAHVKAVEQKH